MRLPKLIKWILGIEGWDDPVKGTIGGVLAAMLICSTLAFIFYICGGLK
jgi:hypothetical protein